MSIRGDVGAGTERRARLVGGLVSGSGERLRLTGAACDGSCSVVRWEGNLPRRCDELASVLAPGGADIVRCGWSGVSGDTGENGLLFMVLVIESQVMYWKQYRRDSRTTTQYLLSHYGKAITVSFMSVQRSRGTQ